METGPNNRQNFPVITSAVGSGGHDDHHRSLNSTASTAFSIDFYSNAACDSSGYGEGQTFWAQTTVNTDGSCNANINVALPVTLGPGAVVTATATDPQGNTSEFSQCAQAIGMNPRWRTTTHTASAKHGAERGRSRRPRQRHGR